MLAVLIGLMINTIGIDHISGVTRFTFGTDALYDGFHLIPALIGLFALSVVFKAIEKGDLGKNIIDKISGKFPFFPES